MATEGESISQSLSGDVSLTIVALAKGAGQEQPQGILTAAGQEASCPGAPIGPLSQGLHCSHGSLGNNEGTIGEQLGNNLWNNSFY